MAISLLGTPSSGGGTGATLTVSHTVTSGTDVLVVCVQEAGNTADTTSGTCTYGGVSMTSKVSLGVDLTGTNDQKAYIFYLKSPTAGTANIVYTCGDTSPNASALQASNWDGVDISGDPFEASNSATSTTGAPSVAVVTLTDGSVVIDSVACQNGSAITKDASQTLIAEVEDAGGAGSLSGGASYELKATAGSTTMSWADLSGTDWIIVGAALKKANLPPTVVLNSPADASSDSDTTPTLDFTGTDADSDSIEYEVQVDSTNFGTTATYYFNASDGGPTDPNSVWSSDANGFDGNTGTTATTSTGGNSSSNYLMGEGTNAPTSGGTIIQVRARVMSGGIAQITGEIYTDGLAAALGTLPPVSGADTYSSYVTLSTPSGGWTWQKLNDLEVKIWRSNGVNAGLNIVEIEVTSVLLDKFSVTPDAGFVNPDTGGDTHPFNSGENIQFTVQAGDALAAGTYYWRVRGLDPSGSNTYGDWSSTRSFLVTGAASIPNKIIVIKQAVNRGNTY